MSTNTEDRYYEPEDDDLEAIWEALEEHIEEMIGQGGEFEWCDPELFYEALTQCGYDDDSIDGVLITPENCSEEIKEKCKEYAYKVAKYNAERRYL